MSTPSSRWHTRAVGQQEHATVNALFEHAFDQPLTAAMWRWKYARERGHAMFVCTADDTPIAHYGGWSRAISLQGQKCHALQPMDVLVKREERGILTKKGPMYLGAQALFAAQIGHGKKHVLGFGFPTGRAARLGERLQLYVAGGEVAELRWPCDIAVAKDWAISARVMNDWPLAQFMRFADAAWARMAQDFSSAILGIRDGQWLQYRYRSHPQRSYFLLAVRHRLTRQALGVAVLSLHDDGRCELLDIVGARDDFNAIVRVARRFARACGKRELYGWFAQANLATLNQTRHAAIHAIDMRLVFMQCSLPPQSHLRQHWWLSSGDMDFR